MNPDELRITLNIAQLVMLGGLIWGLARMSKSVEMLTIGATKVTAGMDKISEALSLLAGRVLVLEDRVGRRATDTHR